VRRLSLTLKYELEFFLLLVMENFEIARAILVVRKCSMFVEVYQNKLKIVLWTNWTLVNIKSERNNLNHQNVFCLLLCRNYQKMKLYLLRLQFNISPQRLQRASIAIHNKTVNGLDPKASQHDVNALFLSNESCKWYHDLLLNASSPIPVCPIQVCLIKFANQFANYELQTMNSSSNPNLT